MRTEYQSKLLNELSLITAVPTIIISIMVGAAYFSYEALSLKEFIRLINVGEIIFILCLVIYTAYCIIRYSTSKIILENETITFCKTFSKPLTINYKDITQIREGLHYPNIFGRYLIRGISIKSKGRNMFIHEVLFKEYSQIKEALIKNRNLPKIIQE
jgi:hypothetical protein